MKIWAVANQKGGVGKTTTVVTLGGLLAKRSKVLLIDLDPQASLTSYFNFNPDDVPLSTFNMFDQELSLELMRSLVKTTDFINLDIMLGSPSLATVEKNSAREPGMGLLLSKALSLLESDYDYILIDTSPALGMLLVNALAACERLLIPVQTEHLAIKGLERMMRTINMVMRSQRRELDYIVIPTLYDRRTQASLTSLEKLEKQYESNIWPSAIGVDTKLRDASAAGIPPSLYCSNSRGVRAYSRLLDFVNGVVDEPVNMEESSNPSQRKGDSDVA